MIFQLTLNAVLGGITGFITNKYAINMLFEKKFGLGGVVLERHKEFAQSFSELVEKDLINQHTIQTELQKPKFKQAIQATIADLLHNSLGARLNIKVQDIPQMAQTLDNTIKFTEQQLGAISEELADICFKQIKLTDVLSTGQIANITENLSAEIATILDLKLAGYLKDINSEIADKTLQEILTTPICEQIIAGGVKSLADLHLKIKDLDPEIDVFLDGIYEHLKIETLLHDLEKMIKEKNLLKIISVGNTENFVKETLKRISNSPALSDLLEKLLCQLIAQLKNLEMPLSELLGSGIEAKLHRFLKNNMPEAVEQLVQFIKNKELDLEHLVEKTIDAQLSQDTSWVGDLKSFLKQHLVGNITQKFQLANKMVTWLKQHEQDDQMPQKLTANLIDYLKENTVGAIITDLEKNNLLPVPLLARLFRKNINFMLNEIDPVIISNFVKDKTVGDFFDLEISNIGPESFKKVFKNKVIYTPRTTSSLQKEFKKQAAVLAEKPWQAMHLNLGDLTPVLIKLFNEQQAKWQNILTGQISLMLTNKTLADFGPLTAHLQKIVIVYATDFTRHQLDSQREKDLAGLTALLERNASKFNLPVTNFIIEVLNANMHAVLKGRVSGLVAKQLQKYPPEEVRDKVQDFMGKELRPITRLGAGLGVLAGSSIYGFQYFTGITLGYYSLAINPAVFAVTGMATNWLAIKMLFRPYHEKRFFKARLPFTPGVVGQNKARFAARTAVFIRRELLNQQVIIRKVAAMPVEAKQSFITYLAQDDYRQGQHFITKNAVLWALPISTWVTAQTFSYLKQASSDLSLKLTTKITGLDLTKIDTRLIKDLLFKALEQNKSVYTGLLKTGGAQFIQQNQALSKTMPLAIIDRFKEQIDQRLAASLTEYLTIIKDEQGFQQLLSFFEEDFQQLLTKSTKEILPLPVQKKLAAKLINYILAMLASAETKNKLLQFAKMTLAKELDANKKVKNLFNGLLVKIVRKNFDYISALVFENVSKEVKGLLLSKRNNIIDEAKEYVRQQGFLVSIFSSLLGVDDDIEKVVATLIEVEIPGFIQTEEENIKTLVTGFLDRQFDKSLSGIGLLEHELELAYLQKLLESTWDKLTANKQVRVEIAQFLYQTLNQIMDLKLAVILQTVAVQSWEDVLAILADEVQVIRQVISENIVANRAGLLAGAGVLTAIITAKIFSEIKQQQIFSEVKAADVDLMVANIFQLAQKTNSLHRSIGSLIDHLLNSIKEKGATSALQPAILQQDLEKTIFKLAGEKQLQAAVQAVISPLVVEFIQQCPQIVAGQTKDFIINVLVDSVLASVKNNITMLVNSIDIQAVVEQAINNMNPKEVEALFNSFAGDYLRKLVGYGGGGAVFGVPGAGVSIWLS
ncbi:DUF445 family protein [Peptococcaceae bacterium]|nr:DUF445 family protein [Peptococcaceae bacterium]